MFFLILFFLSFIHLYGSNQLLPLDVDMFVLNLLVFRNHLYHNCLSNLAMDLNMNVSHKIINKLVFVVHSSR